MSKQVSLFKFFGGTSKRNVSIQSTQRNDNAEVKAVLNNLLKKVVENKRKEKKPDAEKSLSLKKYYIFLFIPLEFTCLGIVFEVVFPMMFFLYGRGLINRPVCEACVSKFADHILIPTLCKIKN